MDEEREYCGRTVGLGAFSIADRVWKGHWRVRVLDEERSGEPHFAEIFVGQRHEVFVSPQEARDRAFEDAKELIDKLADHDTSRRPHEIGSIELTSGGRTSLVMHDFLARTETFRVSQGDVVQIACDEYSTAWEIHAVELVNGSLELRMLPSDAEAVRHADALRQKCDSSSRGVHISITLDGIIHGFWADPTTTPMSAKPWPVLDHVVTITPQQET